jgi:cytochrome c biogenesis protein CcdA
MAQKSITISGVVAGIVAIVAGALILFNWLPLNIVVGVFLIVWGVLALINK